MTELASLEQTERDRLLASRVTSLEYLHEINGEPHPLITEKHTTYLTPLIADYIALCPYLLLASSAVDGSTDVTPRGDPPGFVRVLDPKTIAIPERPGNRRIDTLANIVSRPYVGTLFLIPAVDETLRINGRAWITRDAEMLESMAVSGRAPKLAIIVDVDEVYMHCARSILRAELWDPEGWPDPDDVPTLRAIYAEQKDWPAPAAAEDDRSEEYRSELY